MTTNRKPDVVLMKYGSHLYGLNTPASDVDYKGIFLNTVDELLLGEGPAHISYSTGPKNAKNSSTDVDYDIMNLHTFIKDAIAGQTYALDMLHCTDPESTSSLWEHLVVNRTKFYSRNMKSYVGYLKSQAAKYSIKGARVADIEKALITLNVLFWKYETRDDIRLGDVKDILYFGNYAKWIELDNPKAGTVDEYYEVNNSKYQSTNTVAYVIDRLTEASKAYGHRAHQAKDNGNLDWKSISHAFRVGYQSLHIYTDGDYSYPLPETEFIKDIKTGKLDYVTVVAPALAKLIEDVDKAADNCTLPEKVDVNYWKSFLVEHYRKIYDIERFDGDDYLFRN